ncbi:hypothetical protein ACP70R_040519 [Stipagrostis hirtigluma subsp. patula]
MTGEEGPMRSRTTKSVEAAATAAATTTIGGDGPVKGSYTADAAVDVTGAFEGTKPADSATGVAVATTGGFGDEEPPVPEGKIRLSKEWVEFVLAMDRKPFLDLCNEIVNAAEPGPYMSQELADETRKVYLAAAKDHEELYDWIAEIQNGFRRQYELKGVVDVDDDYYEKVEKAKQANRAAYLKVFGDDCTEVSGKEA